MWACLSVWGEMAEPAASPAPASECWQEPNGAQALPTPWGQEPGTCCRGETGPGPSQEAQEAASFSCHLYQPGTEL